MALPSDPGIRRLLVQAVLGALVGWAVLGGLLVTDAAGLATLIAGSDVGVVALILLGLQFGGGFASFVVAGALALPSGGAPRGRAVAPARIRPDDAPAFVVAASRPRRR